MIALVAVLVGILFLYLEMSLYEFKFKGGPPVVRMVRSGYERSACRRVAVACNGHRVFGSCRCAYPPSRSLSISRSLIP